MSSIMYAENTLVINNDIIVMKDRKLEKIMVLVIVDY